MTCTTEPITRSTSRWRRLLTWLKAIDDAFDQDQAAHASDRLGREIATLQAAVRRIEERLSMPQSGSG